MKRVLIFPAPGAYLPRLASLTLCLAAWLGAGCSSHNPVPPAPDPEEGARADLQVISAVHDAAVANAILAQHTIYPFHFVANGKDLNELGERDLAVLADSYRANPGDLNVRRGDAADALYDARVKAVRDALARAGVDVARVTVADGLPPGSGLPSEDVIRILQSNWKDAGKGYPDTGGTGASSGSNGSSSGMGGGSGSGSGASSSGGMR